MFEVVVFVIALVAAVLLGGALWIRTLAHQAEKIAPRRGAILPVGGGALHYVDKGTGDKGTLVLIHGIAGQLQHFTYAMLDLLKDDFRVIAVDRPGCGYSLLDAGDGASLGDQARMIDELLGQLGVDRAIVVGHSLGGAVALRMALDHPARVAGLALLCPLTQALPEVPVALKGLQVSSSRLRHFLGRTIAVPIARLTANKVLAQVYSPEQCPDDFMERAGAALGLRPQAFVTACSDMTTVGADMPLQAARYGDRLKTPGAILYGADDDLLSPELHGQSMTEHGLSLETLPGRGHMIPITAPQECADFIRRVAQKAI